MISLCFVSRLTVFISCVKICMSTAVKFTKSGIPVPLDSFGNEMCLLFIKYGRCRFKKKCKKSHWTPPLPDEEYPELPPLPLSSPPCSSSLDNHPSSNRNITSQPSGEERQNLPATEKSYYQTKCTAYVANDNTGWASTESESPYSQGFFASQVPKNHHLPGCYTQDEILKVTQPLVQDMSDDIQIDPDPVFTCTTVTSSRSPTFGSSFQDLILNTTNSINDSECSAIDGATPVNENVTVVLGLEKTVDRMVQEICQGKCRFDYVYHPNRQTKGNDCRYLSNTDQSYKQYGAYYDRVRRKLQVQNETRNKAEKKRLKLIRKAHWNACQVLKTRLAQLPPSYSLNVNFAQVNFNRLRPYFHLLVQQCFFCVEPAETQWRPTAFSCLVADTLIAFFTNCNITPVEAEKKMLDWGAWPVRVRQCISHMWSIIVKSSLSSTGVAQEVVACEKQVFEKKLCAVDYAYACSLAAPLMKATENRSTPTITKSVRKGIQAARKASRVGQKPKVLKLKRVGENLSARIKSAPVEETSTTLHKGVSETKLVTCKKKRRTRRSRQLSFLDQQEKQDLKKRCEAILDNAIYGP